MVAVAKRCNCTTEDLLRVPPATEAGSGGPRGRHRIIVHVDMDCFFASVASRDSPHLRGKPIAVCHAAGDSRPGTSGAHGGEISSCSYEARAFGVRAGMFLGKARTLCPDLTTVPYDFDAYERVSVIIYALFYGISDRAVVQASSIDEAYLDLTNVFPASSSLSLTPEAAVEEAVRKLRDDIFAQTGCRASAGIGPCKLVARLATSRSKPNGQLRVAAQDAAEFVLTVPVKGLPGIGRRTSARLEEMGIADCGRLRAVPLSTLQQLFGERVGQSFYHVCRGQDGSPVEPLKPRKSIGAEVSWGVRFGADDDGKVVNFLTSIAHEVAARCKAVRGLGSKVTLKVYRKKPNAGPPGKVRAAGLRFCLVGGGPGASGPRPARRVAARRRVCASSAADVAFSPPLAP
jgi:DNA repair protein REV1